MNYWQCYVFVPNHKSTVPFLSLSLSKSNSLKDDRRFALVSYLLLCIVILLMPWWMDPCFILGEKLKQLRNFESSLIMMLFWGSYCLPLFNLCFKNRTKIVDEGKVSIFDSFYCRIRNRVTLLCLGLYFWWYTSMVKTISLVIHGQLNVLLLLFLW